ncbi:uncharacterized protein PGTG_13979 [Puccinia graminis f. sp. tritici CRL 75-36-700-3]|uniref:Uncharacterized protein n=1 Tax=Puccinia graminis f. sp. tritici (strain CRL 75-36-700-3 / race SCCL) TaxID=418459 RepID=E3KTI3_PUCGT|nr:uncharacterized protein PGTG_13979 [Puccinia graminis f. sp. tritici CRL 75-36-700-3]EFP87608.1 hypothetical protein PGTG_13979 [Puccinia graminis f. sp. tritici CRL 75-36-700-3]
MRLSANLTGQRLSIGGGDPDTNRNPVAKTPSLKLWDDADSFALNEKYRHQETNPHLQRPSIFQTVSLVLPWSSFLPRLSTRRYGNRFKSAFGCPNDFQLKIPNSRLHLTPIAEDNDYVHWPTRNLASWLSDIPALDLRLFKAETKTKHSSPRFKTSGGVLIHKRLQDWDECQLSIDASLQNYFIGPWILPSGIFK